MGLAKRFLGGISAGAGFIILNCFLLLNLRLLKVATQDMVGLQTRSFGRNLLSNTLVAVVIQIHVWTV